MKKRFLVIFIMILLEISLFAVKKNDYGAGIMVGEPTGITLKYKNFPILGFAWSFDNYLHIHADYWIDQMTLTKKVDLFYGGGIKYKYRDDEKKKDNGSSIGIRLPVGVQFFPKKRIEIFFELAPGIMIIPDTEISFNIGLGCRYYFSL